MKRITAVLFLVIVLLALTGCCPNDSVHLTQIEVFEIQMGMDDHNTYHHTDFEDAYYELLDFVEAKGSTSEQEALEIMRLYTEEFLKGVQEAEAVLNYAAEE